MAAGAISVLTFSVVLAEVFGAVGLSTLVPATFVQIARAAANIGDENNLTQEEMSSALKAISRFLPGSQEGVELATKVLLSMMSSSENLELLLPKTASIDAEFKFQATTKVDGGIDVGVMVQVVSVKGGYSALYEESSSNSVNLKVNYVAVQVPIKEPKPLTFGPASLGPLRLKKLESVKKTVAQEIKSVIPADGNFVIVTGVGKELTITGKAAGLETVIVTYLDDTSDGFPVTVTE
ncbi:MAG: hypothetical protein ACOYON_02740 [Fimbriimonas sp.]